MSTLISYGLILVLIYDQGIYAPSYKYFICIPGVYIHFTCYPSPKFFHQPFSVTWSFFFFLGSFFRQP